MHLDESIAAVSDTQKLPRKIGGHHGEIDVFQQLFDP